VPALEGAGTDFSTARGDKVAGFSLFRRPRRARDQRGAVAVEFALIMPFLCLLVFGIIEFGYMLNRDMIIGNTSRDGVRAASLGDPYVDICKAIKSELSGSGIPVPNPAAPTNCADSATSATQISISCKKPDGTACNATPTTYDALAVSGSTTTVKVTYRHTLITPFISSVLGDAVTLEQSTQMRVE
jgi:Flp pilus assembly protein TadG